MKRVVNLNEWLENRNEVEANETSNSVDEAYDGKMADFKYDLEMAVEEIGFNSKAIKKVSKVGKRFEVRMSSYMSQRSTWEKIGELMGATLVEFKPDPKSINVGLYESVETEVNERMPEPRKDEYFFLVRNNDAKDVWKMADYEFGNDIDRNRIEVLFQKNKYVIKDFELAKRFYQYLRDRGVKFFDQNFVSESVEVNEARSLNKIQKDFSAVTSEMAEVVQNWKAAKESGDAKAEANLLARLKELTAKKKGLEREMDEFVMGKDRDAELAGVLEALLTEAKFKTGQVWLWKHVDGDKEVEVINVKPNGDVVGRVKGTSQDFIVRDANKYLKKKISESIVNEAKVDLAQLTDILANLEDAFTEEEFIEVGQDVNVDAKTMQDIWNGYWEVDAKNRLHWGDKEWAKWLKANYGVK